MFEILVGALCVIGILALALFMLWVSAYIILDIIEEFRKIKRNDDKKEEQHD